MVRKNTVYRSYGLQTGDLIGFVGKGPLSDFINLVTFGVPRWSLSHVGLILKEGDDIFIVESLLGQGVVKRPYAEAVRGAKCWLYPLSRELYAHEERRLRKVLNGLVGTPYSHRKAFWAGAFARVFKIWFGRENKQGLFCSEMAALALSEMGALTTGNYSAWSPNRLARYVVRAGICEPPILLPRIT